MLLKDVLLRDPSRYDLVNNGQARIQNESADEKMLAQLRGELSSFVCEGQYEQNNYRLLDARDGWNYLAVPISLNSAGVF